VFDWHDLHGGSAMSTTLNLTASLLATGRKYQKLGRKQDALDVLNKLTEFRRLESEVARETQACLAEILLDQRRYQKARRHLTAALALQPNNAHYHHMMATALAEDDHGDEHRGMDHFRKSLQLAPNNPGCLSEFGLLALWVGHTEEGLGCLCRAVELAPYDPEIVSRLVEGLQQENRDDEARKVLQAARFRNPRDGRFRQLWQEFQFRQLRRQQQSQRWQSGPKSGALPGPTLLPFVRSETPAKTVGVNLKVVRQDEAAPPPPPHTSRPKGLRRQRHAQ
jgi:tetratricopeptide (TPR) repeat protein